MAQPDFDKIVRHLGGISEQVSLMNNQPAMSQGAQILAAIQAMEGRLVARIDQTNVRIDQTNARITELAQAQQINDRKSVARALNSAALNNEARLYALPLPNGDEIPEGQFPDTVEAFRALLGAQLAWLLEAYKLVVPPGASVDDKQDILAMHCGIRY